MFFLVHGPSNRKGDIVAMLFGFFDGSSTHAGGKVWTICGWIGQRDFLEQFDNEWKLILNKKDWPRPPKEFRTYDCVHKHGEFQDWSFAERLALLGDLATLISKSNLLALGSIVIVDDLSRLEPAELSTLQSQALATPLDLSLQYIFQQTIVKTRDIFPGEKISILFDQEPDFLAERYFAFSNRYQRSFGHVFDGIGFGDSKVFTPLQAADMLAYSTYRFELQRRFGKEDGDFPVIPSFMRLITSVAADGGGYDLESLKKLVVLIKDNRNA